NLTFLHGLEQCALHFRRSPVDLISKNEVAENRTFFNDKFFFFLIGAHRCDKVGGKQVRGKLQSAEIYFDGIRKGFDGECFGQSGYTFQQYVPVRQQCNEQLLEHVLLPDNDFFHLQIEQVDESTFFFDAFVERPDVAGNLTSGTCEGRKAAFRRGRI